VSEQKNSAEAVGPGAVGCRTASVSCGTGRRAGQPFASL